MKRRVVVVIVLMVAAASGLLSIGEFLSQPAQRAVGAAPADLGATAIAIATGNGQTVAGWSIRGDPGAGVVLLLHGIRADRRQMLERARLLKSRHFSVVLIDLPAHGESSGDRMTFGVREGEGVRAALGYLATAFPGEKSGVIGASLGAASFVLAQSAVAPDAVVLESMFPTLEDAVKDRLRIYLGSAGPLMAPLLLWQLPLRTGIFADEVRPIDMLPRLHAPVLIASGSADRNTTPDEARRLFAAAAAPRELWIVEGAAHQDLYAFDRHAYESHVLAFLTRYLY